MPWYYVDHPCTGDILPCNTCDEVAVVAGLLESSGEAAANIYAMRCDVEEIKDDDEIMEVIRGAWSTGYAVLRNGTIIHPTPKGEMP